MSHLKYAVHHYMYMQVHYLFREIVSYKRNVQNNKQYLSALLRRAKEKRLEPYTIPSPPSSTGAAIGASSDETNEEPKAETVSKINPKWTQEELLLGVEGMYSHCRADVKGPNYSIFDRHTQVWQEFQGHHRDHWNKD